MLLTAVRGRPAHLRRVHHALIEPPRRRPASGSGSSPTGRPDRTCSPTANSSAPSACSPQRWPRTRRTVPRPRRSHTFSTSCSKRASRCSASPPRAATPWTGPTTRPGHAHHPSPAPNATIPTPPQTTPRTPSSQRQTPTTATTATTATPTATMIGDAPTPKRRGDTAAATTPARKTSCSTATTSKPPRPSQTSTAPRSPSSPDACT